MCCSAIGIGPDRLTASFMTHLNWDLRLWGRVVDEYDVAGASHLAAELLYNTRSGWHLAIGAASTAGPISSTELIRSSACGRCTRSSNPSALSANTQQTGSMEALNRKILERQGPLCILPDCDEPWTEKAEIDASGIGGRPSTCTAENLVGRCRTCHAIFDGRILQGRQRMLRTLMRSLAEFVAQARFDASRLSAHEGTEAQAIHAHIRCN